MRTVETRPPKVPPPWVNRTMTALLRSPLSRLVDRGIALLTVYGRRTGRAYTFPVQYAEEDGNLWLISGAGAEKTWWRNLVGGARVELLLRRRRRTGHAIAYTHAEHPQTVEEGLRRYVARFPGMARRLGITDDADSLAAAAVDNVVVRVDLDDA
jgi:deazaflavin-dependent oxidoreductase (nitroreductase family)